MADGRLHRRERKGGHWVGGGNSPSFLDTGRRPGLGVQAVTSCFLQLKRSPSCPLFVARAGAGPSAGCGSGRSAARALRQAVFTTGVYGQPSRCYACLKRHTILCKCAFLGDSITFVRFSEANASSVIRAITDTSKK